MNGTILKFVFFSWKKHAIMTAPIWCGPSKVTEHSKLPPKTILQLMSVHLIPLYQRIYAYNIFIDFTSDIIITSGL